MTDLSGSCNFLDEWSNVALAAHLRLPLRLLAVAKHSSGARFLSESNKRDASKV